MIDQDTLTLDPTVHVAEPEDDICCLSKIDIIPTRHPEVQCLTASVPLPGVTGVPVLSPESSLVRSPPSHPTGIKQRCTARSSPGTVVVTVLLRPALCSGVDGPQLRVTHCGFVALPADVSLVSVDTERTSLLSVTLRASDRTSVREPVAGLAVFPFLAKFS